MGSSKGEGDCTKLGCILFAGVFAGTLIVAIIFAASGMADAIIGQRDQPAACVILALLFIALMGSGSFGLVWCVAHGRSGRRHTQGPIITVI